ncbi:MAG: putative polysaccharide deacetylase [Candidatus Scalindua rubra]|uniref:Putative polysaccharide deacetylase n=1 Tax=Candidatus Scalindua rubra TaxID=1872076 RepID=A0A1E3XDR0_9BACT|nr:MAG: putative polysaccharide deacetylase [Candidatus Scalindua rubra]
MEVLNTQEAIILLYHGVTSENYCGIENYSGKHIHKDVFKQQISVLSKACNPVSLRTLVNALKEELPLPSKTVAVTFDDCFENVYINACPILEKYNVPATMFITTGFVNTKRIIWADMLEVAIANTLEEVIVFDFLKFSKKYYIISSVEKIKVINEIKSILKSVDENTRDKIMESFTEGFEFRDEIVETDLYRNLTWDQLREIDRCSLFEIGPHTINHRVLSFLDIKEAEREIVGSKNILERELGHNIDLFSYPEGQREHYNENIISILKENGFISSPSAIYGSNKPGDSPFHLKRVMVGFNGIPFPYS